jgi:hypothetical protein
MTLFDSIASPDAGAIDAKAGSRGAIAVAPYRTKVWSTPVFLCTIASLFLFLAGAFAIWRLADAVVPWDSKNHFYPMFRFLADALRHGTIPLWNPYHFSGYPAIADPQSLIFTPSMMLFALIAPDASMPVFDGVILGHLFVGGVGVLCLARRWGWHPAAGLLTTLVFVFGGAASGRLEHTGMIISYIYFPWALWSLQGALARRSLAWAVLAGLSVALMALGRDQVAFMLCLCLLGIVVREAWASRKPLAYLLSRSAVLFCTGAVTVACMIVPILLTLQFVHDSNRPSITYGVALAGSLNPINLLTLIAPNIFGTLNHVYDYWGPGTGLIRGNDWTDKTDRTMDYMFIGTVPVVLLVWQGLAGGRLLERGVRFFAALFVFALVYAFGRYTPLFSLIFDWVPGVSLYRRPADASFPINVGLAFGAGYLLHCYILDGMPHPRAMLPRRLAWALPVVTLVGVASLIGVGLAFTRRYGQVDASLIQLAIAVGFVAVAVAVFVVPRTRRMRAMAASVLVLATAGELAWRNAASAVNAEPIATYSAYAGLYPDEAAGLAILRSELARRKALGEHPRVELIGLNGSWQNASMVLKIEDTIGYNPLRISDYERAVGPVESAVDIGLRHFPGLFRGYTGRLASMLGLDYLVVDRPLDQLPRHYPRPKADLLFAGNRFYVYRLLNQQTPRAYLATHVKAVNSADVITDEKMPDFDLGREALIDTKDVAGISQPLLLAAASPAASAGTTSITSYEDNAVSIAVDTPAAGVVVLHDLAYPGWTVRVDGRQAPLLRANILFRGVEVPAGRHTVEFRFHPLSLSNLWAAAGNLMRSKR